MERKRRKRITRKKKPNPNPSPREITPRYTVEINDNGKVVNYHRRAVVKMVQGGEVSYHSYYTDALRKAGFKGDATKLHAYMNAIKYQQKEYLTKGFFIDEENFEPFHMKRIPYSTYISEIENKE